MYDFHMHSWVSFDCDADPAAMAWAAGDAGLSEICFTDHVDPDPSHPLSRGQILRPEEYREAYDGLTVPGVVIRRGLELGMVPGRSPLAEEALSWYSYDFVIGSVHYAQRLDPYKQEFWVGRSPQEARVSYLQEVLRCLQDAPDFDVLGHLTYPSKWQPGSGPARFELEDCRELTDEILRRLIALGRGIELNTSGLQRTGDFLPPRAFLRRFAELGGEIVTVGSDAHTPDRVGRGIPQALDVLREEMGHVCTFAGRSPVFHKL